MIGSAPTPVPGPAGSPAARLAASEDVDQLADLYRAAVAELSGLRGGRALIGLQSRQRPLEASLSSEIASGDRFVVAGLLGTSLVGYGACGTVALGTGELIGSISDLFVHPEARRQGVGRAVAAKLLEWCNARSCIGVDASALPGSRAVKSFFEGQGFTARLLVMHRRLG